MRNEELIRTQEHVEHVLSTEKRVEQNVEAKNNHETLSRALRSWLLMECPI